MRIVALLSLVPALASALDLHNAVIVSPPTEAARMLTEEIAKRTQIRLPVSSYAVPNRANILLTLTDEPTPLDSYRVTQQGPNLTITASTPRAVLFGVGYLLRHLHMERQVIEAPNNIQVSEAPRYALRGHQLGYRPKVNTYDAWTPAQFEQYIRDLVVFGTNAIELIPPRSDDQDDSPHFKLSKLDMMEEVSKICDRYGLDVWIWFPAMDQDYSKPATVDFALKEWDQVYRRLKRIDAVFVPGGDPGHTRPKYLMALLEKQTAQLHRTHPQAQMWMSPQGFSAEWLSEWFDLLNQKPAWLNGVVHGPQVRISIPEMRAKVPSQYPLRLYPDITHSLRCQYPVPDWDPAYAATEGRESINPRPTQYAEIFHRYEKQAVGFLTYSEGVNDDVNKFVWSGLGWNPDQPVLDILQEYASYFLGNKDFAQGLMGLEQNWVGNIATNKGVDATLALFQKMETNASPQLKANWRFQQAIYRSHYDYYIRSRVLNEPALWARARVFEMAEALFQSIGMQLSVPRYQAEARDRGANLDAIDAPLPPR